MRTHHQYGTRYGRMPVLLGLGVAATLTLGACAGSPGGGETPSGPADGATQSAGTPSAGTTSAGATAGAGEGATHSAPGTVSGSATQTPPSDEPSGDPLDGPTQTYTTRSGIFTWTLPEDWTVDVEAGRSTDTADLTGGIPYESVEFTDPRGAVTFTALTGVGPTDGDGWKPQVVDIVEAQQLTGVPVAQEGGPGGLGTGPVYLQGAITRAVDPPSEAPAGSDPREEGEFGLALHVANVDEGSDPEEPEDFHSNWVYYLDPPADAGQQAYGTANFLHAEIDQDDAEEITGLRGEEAVRAVLDTREYATVRAVMASLEVELP